ncbi:hypothetical protein [Paenochrobactrum pullorum]|uniref:hypothetical protein n=1 Tax=Paenochrobactrum pullorum TaxID=1324351 RepID=UPI0035BBF8B7
MIMTVDRERHELLIKSVILSHLQDQTKTGSDGFKILSDFLVAAKFCRMKDENVSCNLTDDQNTHARAIKLLMKRLLHDGANHHEISEHIINYTEALLKTYQGEYPEQS